MDMGDFNVINLAKNIKCGILFLGPYNHFVIIKKRFIFILKKGAEMLRESEYLPKKGVAIINDAEKLLHQLCIRKTPQEIIKFLRGKTGKLRLIIIGEIQKTGAVVFLAGSKKLSLMPDFFSEIKYQ